MNASNDLLITQDYLNSLVPLRKFGISGLMRVRNEEKTIRQSIESIIHIIDELIVVYHDCTDNTVSILNELQTRYITIRVYEYSQPVLQANSGLYVEGFNPAHSLANYYNYGLSKCNYKWVMKVDADQIYFAKELLELFAKKQPGAYYCMVGFNVAVDCSDKLAVSSFEGLPLNGHHGDHFLTEIKIGSGFIIPKYPNGNYYQFETYYEPGIEWHKFDFSIGGAYWYHIRFFKDMEPVFYFSENEQNSVLQYINFNYLRSKLDDKYTDEKINKIIDSFYTNKALLKRSYYR